MGRARVLQAVRRLDLGWRLHHGAGRVHGAFGSPLSRPQGGRGPGRCGLREGLRMKALKFIVPLAVFLALAIFFAIGLTRDPRTVPSPFIDKPAPAFKLEQLHQSTLAFTPEQMKGKVWMLNVWASWCASCRVEHPLL